MVPATQALVRLGWSELLEDVSLDVCSAEDCAAVEVTLSEVGEAGSSEELSEVVHWADVM